MAKKNSSLNFKKNYYRERNSILKAKKNIRLHQLAENEINTFFIIARLSGFEQKSILKNKKILDLGSGDQFLKCSMVKRKVDYNPIDIDTTDFNTDQLPFKSNSFDIIFSLAVIEHINGISNYLSEVRRVLKPGGLFYLSTPNFRYCYKSFYDDPTHVNPFTDKSLEKVLFFNSFKNVSIYPGVRNKPDWFYKGSLRFLKCSLIPFREKRWFLPRFFTGRATSIFGICTK